MKVIAFLFKSIIILVSLLVILLIILNIKHKFYFDDITLYGDLKLGSHSIVRLPGEYLADYDIKVGDVKVGEMSETSRIAIWPPYAYGFMASSPEKVSSGNLSIVEDDANNSMYIFNCKTKEFKVFSRMEDFNREVSIITGKKDFDVLGREFFMADNLIITTRVKARYQPRLCEP